MNYNLAKLQEQFQAVKNDFFDCQNKLLEAARTLEVSPEKSDELLSLPELESLLANIKKAEEERSRATEVRQQALTVLDRVLTIFHRDNSNFKPLLQSKEKADKLRRQISESVEVKADPESEALAEGNHAFSLLLKLIEGADELDDDRLTELQDEVALSFERTLATAALRGKLAFGTTPTPAASISVPVIEAPPAETEKAIAPPPVVPPIAPPTDESPPWGIPEEETTEAPVVEPPVVEPPMVPPPIAPATRKDSQEQFAVGVIPEEERSEAPVVEPPVVEPPMVPQTIENSQEQPAPGVMSEEELVELAGKKGYIN